MICYKSHHNHELNLNVLCLRISSIYYNLITICKQLNYKKDITVLVQVFDTKTVIHMEIVILHVGSFIFLQINVKIRVNRII